jgi:exodeoxyribonuclease V alpha subunit
MTLTPRQSDLVGLITDPSTGVCVGTGGPGTGKTHSLRAALDALDAAGARVELAAPTGKAARRMMEATGRRAQTLHLLLGYKPGQGFSAEPLECDVVVVDEASMMDAELASALVSALTPGRHRLVLVGDVDQLPSVGPGAVLRDVIDSAAVPVVRLDQVMRQAAGSQIITGAHAIIRGERPAFRPWADRETDLRWRRYEDGPDVAEKVAADLLTIVARLMPGRGIDPLRDVQVLTPMRKGHCGTEKLGAALAAALNPDRPGQGRCDLFDGRNGAGAPLTVRDGDRVIQTKNDYQLGVFNGECGRVVECDGGGVMVDYADPTNASADPVLVGYSLAQARKGLRLAYALTIHKSQGSEWPVVVVPVVSEHAYMWSRQLLYTGVTRAKALCVLLGTEKALVGAIGNATDSKRWTSLRRRMERTDTR